MCLTPSRSHIMAIWPLWASCREENYSTAPFLAPLFGPRGWIVEVDCGMGSEREQTLPSMHTAVRCIVEELALAVRWVGGCLLLLPYSAYCRTLKLVLNDPSQ